MEDGDNPPLPVLDPPYSPTSPQSSLLNNNAYEESSLRPPATGDQSTNVDDDHNFAENSMSSVKSSDDEPGYTNDTTTAANQATTAVDAPPVTDSLPRGSQLNASDATFADQTALEATGVEDDHGDSIATEEAVRAHLQDVESSFVKPMSPVATAPPAGLDDTFLFEGTRTQTPKPAAARGGDTTPKPDDTSAMSLDTYSSPTAAATARTASRTRLALSNAEQQPAGSAAFAASDPPPQSSPYNHNTVFPQAEPVSGTGDMSTFTPDSSLRPVAVDAGSTPGHALRGGSRPRYLRSRGGSQRSSTSSFLSPGDDDGSDMTVGLSADYALQSGGAVPMNLSLPGSRSISSILTRSVSMGSMASGIDDSSRGPEQHHLETLDEVDSPPGGHDGGRDEDMLKTPRPAKESIAPTDTVLAQHVRNVKVPESLAQEYRYKSSLMTPRKPSDMISMGGTVGRTGKNLTLKEQSSTIERLSKENFDLKLKVMFLSDRLDKLSEEGIKEMISENVELKMGLAVLQRDNKVLRRRVKELEKRLREEETRPGTARSGNSDQTQSDQEAQEREEEIIYLRERWEECTAEIERLKNESLSKEVEKRKLVEVVRTLGEKTAGEGLGRQEEADVWKDLLEQETARREQADDDNRKLRDEIFKLKQDANGLGGLHHTTNIYNITKKANESASSPNPNRPISVLSADTEALNGALSGTTTLVDDLRRESEHLRHENAELRREVGAQTSMLTSRNREKERLYQEIEDLKMAQRRGGPAPSTVDSLLDRSASRVGAHVRHERSRSRGSGTTRMTVTEFDEERENMESKMADMRDKLNEMKLQNQELQRELDACMEDFETAVAAKQQAESNANGVQEELDNVVNDLVALQAERDEALREQSDMEAEFEALRKEAQDEIDALENEADQRTDVMQRLQTDLSDRTENFEALQEEMRKMSEAVIRLEDEQNNKIRRIQELEAELATSNREMEELEAKLREANDKVNRLMIQQELSQGEIAFLREEQEGDKMRIGDLEAALAGVEQSLRDERDRIKELEQRLESERQQREIVASKEKEEVQQFVNELNKEASSAKDEVRRLRKNLTSREVEATEWKERLMELENNLREALGDLNGTRSSLLKSIAQLQRQLENTVRELDVTKASLMEKDHIIKQRDGLLESLGLESRKMADLLEKERQAHSNTKHQFETFQKTHQHVSRTVTSQDSRIGELESGRAQDRKKLSTLEVQFRDQLTERNNLLLVLWTRLSTLCGSDWAHNNSLINGRALPSLESIATMLPGFSKNLLAAVKTIEGMQSGFSNRIKGIERDLWREYHTLENQLEVRAKKLDRLEALVRNGLVTGNFPSPQHGLPSDAQARMSRLEDAYRQLKVENATLRTANDVRARAAHAQHQQQHATIGINTAMEAGEGGVGGSPSPSVPLGPRDKDRSRKAVSTGRGGSTSRSSSVTAIRPGTGTAATDTALAGQDDAASTGSGGGGGGGGGSGGGGEVLSAIDRNWLHRLRNMEAKLKDERESRFLDRQAARKRLEELDERNRQLNGEVLKLKRANLPV